MAGELGMFELSTYAIEIKPELALRGENGTTDGHE